MNAIDDLSPFDSICDSVEGAFSWSTCPDDVMEAAEVMSDLQRNITDELKGEIYCLVRVSMFLVYDMSFIKYQLAIQLTSY